MKYLLWLVLLIAVIPFIKESNATSFIYNDDNLELDRVKRGVFNQARWCDWNAWSKCSVTCNGKGTATRNRICACRSTNVIKNLVKKVFSSATCDPDKPEVATDRRTCQTYQLCPVASRGFPQVYWIIGGGLFCLILLCLFLWACVSALIRKNKQIRLRSAQRRTQSRELQRISNHNNTPRSQPPLTTPTPPTAPPAPASYTMIEPPPSYEEVTRLQPPRQIALSRSSTVRSNDAPPPRYSDFMKNSPNGANG